ncbi:MAG: methylated-DNA--[protein]-cysteine S-methyltransferase [Chloroflexota bacterium]
MTTAHGFALFETTIGTCAVAWNDHGLTSVQLPGASHALRRRASVASEVVPPPAIQSTIDAMVGLLEGKPSDLSCVGLDMAGISEFDRCVYAVARTIPPGATLSYGDIAARLGEPAWPAARNVGQALGRNPFPIVVPSHRVVAAGGKLGGFSGPGGLKTKLRLLSIEAAFSSAGSRVAFETARAGARSAAALDCPLFAQLQ